MRRKKERSKQVLLCLVCLFDLACFFLSSHLSFKNMYIYMYMYLMHQVEMLNMMQELSAQLHNQQPNTCIPAVGECRLGTV